MTATQPHSTRDHFHDFDLDSPEFNDDFVEVIDDLVQHCPVARSNVGHGYYVVNRQEDVRTVGQNWETFSSAEGFQPNRPEGMPFMYPEESDPPYHNRWRSALNGYFSPRAVRSYEGSIREHANHLIDQFVERGECDFVADFAATLPGRVFFSSYMGVPLDDLPPLIKAIDDALFGPLEGRAQGWGTALGYINAYLERRLEEEPRGDFVDAVLKGVELDSGEPCPWQHKVSVVTDLLAGGLGTTTYLLAGMTYHLATHPADRARLAADPALHDKAIEEFVRVYAPVVALGRTVKEEVEIGGHTFKKGDWVMLNYAAACRDPRAYENPKTVDIDRDLPVNAAFGFGPHRCIGSHLARIEGKVVMQEFLRRIPDFSLKPGAAITYTTGLTRAMNNLPLVFEPRRRESAL
ncbi:cytochrome P450 [Nonomuraea angiospora]